jgi:hypothetical protein
LKFLSLWSFWRSNCKCSSSPSLPASSRLPMCTQEQLLGSNPRRLSMAQTFASHTKTRFVTVLTLLAIVSLNILSWFWEISRDAQSVSKKSNTLLSKLQRIHYNNFILL